MTDRQREGDLDPALPLVPPQLPRFPETPTRGEKARKTMTVTREPLDLWVPLTDSKGALLIKPADATEPEPGSIVLTEGEHGTAWQRHFVGKRLWHSTTGTTREWGQLLAKRNVVLVYDAAPRPDVSGGQR